MFLSVEQTQNKLQNGSPVILPEGIHPETARAAIRHQYGVPLNRRIRFCPLLGNGQYPANAILSIIPAVSMAERDPRRIEIKFREV